MGGRVRGTGAGVGRVASWMCGEVLQMNGRQRDGGCEIQSMEHSGVEVRVGVEKRTDAR